MSRRPSDTMLTTAELAKRWKCSAVYLRRLRSEGKGPPYTKPLGGGHVLYSLDDIRAHEATHRKGKVEK